MRSDLPVFVENFNLYAMTMYSSFT